MSLNRRIVLSASLVLLIFITLTAAALNRAFIDSSETALRDKLTSQLYALLAAAEVSDNEIYMPSNELDALLGLPSSGVYASIINQAGEVLWQSSSALGASVPAPQWLASGDKGFQQTRVDDHNYYSFAYGINWLDESGSLALTFTISTDLSSFNQQLADYRNTLWGWLSAMALLLLISQALILRWGLKPLRRVGDELNRIEAGEQQQIEHDYPSEIDHLTRNINQLLQHEREQKSRYRNALGDLAHSLKTPLAVLQSGLNADSQADDAMQEQISRMNAIVEYQLQRAATAGSASSAQSLEVKSVLQRMLDSLGKVYRDKGIQLQLRVDEQLRFKGDEGDLMELLGNLLDNACKWARRRVRFELERDGKELRITVEDDGPGVSAAQLAQLARRGVRIDQEVDGHGLGLAISRDVARIYGGGLAFDRAPELGGLRVRARLRLARPV
jgi:two-component system sensor histidine kinase PhoQ